MTPEANRFLVTHNSLHVWSATFTRETLSPTNEAIALLSADELARARRFRRPDDQLLFTRAHIALRQTLSRYAPIAPQNWSFEPGQYGRPEISNPDAPKGLRFNLTHTPGMMAIVVNGAFDAGVDVEGVGRVADLDAMSRTSFSAAERAALLALPSAAQALRFAQTWALKESFIKAMGTGLATPLRAFSFDLSAPGSIGFTCDPDVDPNPSAWSFSVGEPTSNHVLATACRLGSEVAPAVDHLLLGLASPANHDYRASFSYSS